jgi:hypothetical protein
MYAASPEIAATEAAVAATVIVDTPLIGFNTTIQTTKVIQTRRLNAERRGEERQTEQQNRDGVG